VHLLDLVRGGSGLFGALQHGGGRILCAAYSLEMNTLFSSAQPTQPEHRSKNTGLAHQNKKNPAAGNHLPKRMNISAPVRPDCPSNASDHLLPDISFRYHLTQRRRVTNIGTEDGIIAKRTQLSGKICSVHEITCPPGELIEEWTEMASSTAGPCCCSVV